MSKRKGKATRVRREFNHLAADCPDNRLTRWILKRVNARMRRDGSRWELRAKRRKGSRMAIYSVLCQSYRRTCETAAMREHWQKQDGAREYRQVLQIQREATHSRNH